MSFYGLFVLLNERARTTMIKEGAGEGGGRAAQLSDWRRDD